MSRKQKERTPYALSLFLMFQINLCPVEILGCFTPAGYRQQRDVSIGEGIIDRKFDSQERIDRQDPYS